MFIIVVYWQEFWLECGIVMLMQELFTAESKSQVYAALHELLSNYPCVSVAEYVVCLCTMDSILLCIFIYTFQGIFAVMMGVIYVNIPEILCKVNSLPQPFDFLKLRL